MSIYDKVKTTKYCKGMEKKIKFIFQLFFFGCTDSYDWKRIKNFNWRSACRLDNFNMSEEYSLKKPKKNSYANNTLSK